MNQNKGDMILVTGIPRSGTTWISSVLCYADEVKCYFEPDNEHNSILGYINKQQLHRFPYLKADAEKNGLYSIFKDSIEDRYLYDYGKPSMLIKKILGINLESVEPEITVKCEDGNGCYESDNFRLKARRRLAEKLYKNFRVFERYNRQKKLPLIKSVHCLLALPYIQNFFNTRLLIILRHPASIISSCLRLNNPDIFRNLTSQKQLVEDYLEPYIDDIRRLEDPLEKAGAQVAIIYYVISNQLQENKSWMAVKYESICEDPPEKFKTLYERLDLSWSEDISDKIHALNKRGKGYKINRIASEQINKWKKELTPSQIAKIQKGYGVIAPSFYEDFLYPEVNLY